MQKWTTGPAFGRSGAGICFPAVRHVLSETKSSKVTSVVDGEQEQHAKAVERAERAEALRQQKEARPQPPPPPSAPTDDINGSKKAVYAVSGQGASDEGASGQKKVPQPGSSMLGPTLVASLAAAVMFVVYNSQKSETDRLRRAKLKQSVGKPQLGGPFVLIGPSGRLVTDHDLRGRYALVYFGFTHCPDVCPAQLEKLSAVLDLLDDVPLDHKDGGTGGVRRCVDELQPVFITIDPQRDSVARVHAFKDIYDKRVLPLTGTPGQVMDVCRKFRVYVSPVRGGTGKDDYVLDHSDIWYLMDPNGEFVTYYGNSTDVTEMKNSIASIIAQGKMSGDV